MTKRILLLILFSISSLLLFCSCDDDGNGPTEPTAAQLTADGWIKFEAGDDGGAASDFKAANGLDPAYEEAYLGLGWAELRQSHAGLAEEAFETYFLKISGSNDDATAGLALAYHAQDKFQDAIDKATQLLSSSSDWSLGHGSSIDHLDVALVLAHSYYETAQFQSSLEVVRDYFDSGFSVDPDTDQGRDQLAAKLESLYTG